MVLNFKNRCIVRTIGEELSLTHEKNLRKNDFKKSFARANEHQKGKCLDFLQWSPFSEKTWVFVYDPETKRQIVVWYTSTSPRSKKARLGMSESLCFKACFAERFWKNFEKGSFEWGQISRTTGCGITIMHLVTHEYQHTTFWSLKTFFWLLCVLVRLTCILVTFYSSQGQKITSKELILKDIPKVITDQLKAIPLAKFQHRY